MPDLKEAEGGLRDATVLKALVATWLVDVPHVDLERSRLALLDVRDVLHDIAGRPTDRIAPESVERRWPRGLGLADERAAQIHVRELGPPDHPPLAADLAPGRRRAGPAGVASRPTPPAADAARSGCGARRPERWCSTALPAPTEDPLLLLRAAAEAAERDVVLVAGDRRPAGARGRRRCPSRGRGEARQLLVRLLAAGRGLLEVWETLEETGALARILPEWERIRLLPHASAIHRFTVDRHVVETCVEASALIRHVARPDVLMVAALLHDIGKGGLTEHSVAGEPIARERRDPDGLRARRGRPDRHAGALAPAARRDWPRPATPTTRRRSGAGRPGSASPEALVAARWRSPRPTPGPPPPRRGRRGAPG